MVRIVERRSLPRVAAVSLVLTLAAGAVAFAAWRWWQPPPTIPVVPRAVSTIDLTYRCEAGHTFLAPGQVESRLCSTCAEPAYAVTQYACPLHGSFDVYVQFTATPTGGSRAYRWRLGKGEWTENEADLVCPRCQVPLVRRATELGEAAIRAGRKSGG